MASKQLKDWGWEFFDGQGDEEDWGLYNGALLTIASANEWNLKQANDWLCHGLEDGWVEDLLGPNPSERDVLLYRRLTVERAMANDCTLAQVIADLVGEEEEIEEPAGGAGARQGKEFAGRGGAKCSQNEKSTGGVKIPVIFPAARFCS